ncbi:bifunctional hydroxymethylpyrimidine kinase/phosphomethylpyrimidine kinase [Thermodesulfovibrio sp. 3907-1M]|uniref:hydroxymethylpyrimidine kinase n=1 Tax=Thermodesulfovibrio autotrophicus TaxID=3118333 RepID=A0AAU8GVT0_9BACT
MKTTLTIGATDPTSGAGIQMDLKVFHSLDIYGLSIITALTAQSTSEFVLTYPVPVEVIEAQFETLLKDIKPYGAKTGVLYSKETIQCVVEKIKKFNIKNLVVDPVIASTLGAKLIEPEALKTLKEELIPLSMAVTANIPEAEALTEIKIENIDDVFNALKKLYKMGTDIAIIKGGHFKEKAVDVLYDGKDFYKIGDEKYSGEFHGTGCAFSSAFLSFLCLGYEPKEAFNAAKNFIKNAIINALKLGKSMSLLKI